MRASGDDDRRYSVDATGGREKRGCERDAGAEDDDEDADPYPVDQRIEEDLDDGAISVRVAAHEDGVEVARESPVDRNHRQRRLRGRVEAALRSELRNLFGTLEDVEDREIGVVVSVGILGVALADQTQGTDL